jgi:large subunit ribosomal protein L29
MKAKDLRERSTEDLVELKGSIQKDLFSYRMKNYTGQLDDSSLLNKTRKDVARIELILHERALAASGETANKDGGES